jgi:catechol 2,3-dioxygenase-like lactoylglutathione lyase family enzyme
MAIGLKHIWHAKLPVADVAASTAWYRSLLDLELGAEFVEDGELRGVQLFDRDGHFGIALRDRRYCPSRPDLTGFDAFAIEAESVAALHALASHADSLGVAHTGVQDRGEYGANLDVSDPDGTVLRFVTNNPIRPGRFIGIVSGQDQQFRLYDVPRFIIDHAT